MREYTHTHTHTHTNNFIKNNKKQNNLENLNKIREKLSSEQGSVTVYVLSCLLVLLMVIIASYTGIMNKNSNRLKELQKIQEEYSVTNDALDQKYEEANKEEETEPTEKLLKVTLYKESGEVYQTSEYTNKDLRLEINYSGGSEGSKAKLYIDGVETEYTSNLKITNNCTIKVVYEEQTKEIQVTRIDKEKPTTSLKPNGGSFVKPTEGNATISTTITATDTGVSGLDTMQYAWSTINTKEPESWETFKNGQKVSKNDCEEGTYYLWTKVTDKAGNENIQISKGFVVGNNGIELAQDTTEWTNGNVTVTATYGANLTQNKTLTCSGTANTDYTVNGTTNVVVKTNGKTVTATATDIAGNKVTKSLQITNIDKELPTVSLSPNGGTAYTMPSSGNATIKTTITATDTGGSGLNSLEYAWSTSNTTEPSTWTTFTNGSTVSKTDISSAGSYYLWTKVTDKAGNRASTIKVSNAFTVNANTTTANQITLIPNTTAWTNENVTVTATYGANLTQNKTLTCNGTANTDYTVNGTTNVVVKTNNKTITATATDIDGNKVTKTLTITNIDKELPTIALSSNGGEYEDTTGWKGVTVKTDLTAQDMGGSGLNTLQYAWSTSNTSAPTQWNTFTNGDMLSYTKRAWARDYLWTKLTDKAGNIATNVSDAFIVKGWYGEKFGDYYYYYADGSKAVGDKTITWVSEDKTYSNKYHFLADGRMYTGWRSMGDGNWKYYVKYVNENNGLDGTVESSWNEKNASLFPRGALVENSWLYVYDASRSANYWYYCGADGLMQIGWYKDSDGWWYFLYDGGAGLDWPKGTAFTNMSIQIGSKVYNFDASGHCTNP